jgi:hypothetical protein
LGFVCNKQGLCYRLGTWIQILKRMSALELDFELEIRYRIVFFPPGIVLTWNFPVSQMGVED